NLRPAQLVHKQGQFFYCREFGSEAKCPQCMREFVLTAGNCGRASGSRRFSRVNCWGVIQKRASARFGKPGRCGLLKESSLDSRTESLVLRRVRGETSILSGMQDLKAHTSLPCAVKGKLRHPRAVRPGWLARAAFIFWGLFGSSLPSFHCPCCPCQNWASSASSLLLNPSELWPPRFRRIFESSCQF